MKKILSVAMAIIMLATTASASVQSEQCEQQLKGSWAWNGTVNQWQCLDENQTELPGIKPAEQSDANTTGTPSRSVGDLIKSTAIVIAAAPFVIIGTAVTAIVVAPVYLVKKLFGSSN